jgi:hypothetical protein
MVFGILQIVNIVSAILFVLVPKPYVWGFWRYNSS